MPMPEMSNPAEEKPGRSEDGEELALLQLVVDGDRDAFRSLYERYYQPLFRFIYRITRRTDLAEEGAADAMLVVWQNAKSFQGRSRVSTWIMGIGYRKGLKLAERAKRQSERFVSMDSDDVGEPSSWHPEHMDMATLQDWLDVGLRRLPAEQRAVVELTYFHGYSYAEIAGILSCPVNTVKTRMFHARARLRRLLPELSLTRGSGLREDAP
jgi:RNA polymerase sigma-70 factor (ECF subfamily)